MYSYINTDTHRCVKLIMIRLTPNLVFKISL